jgi:hypothetical protein
MVRVVRDPLNQCRLEGSRLKAGSFKRTMGLVWAHFEPHAQLPNLPSSKSKSGSGSRMELLDIGGSMRTVSRQESVSNRSMWHRELLKWHC